MWESAGTVKVTNDSTTVTGSGTLFTAKSRVGDGFIGPDQTIYEIINIVSETVLHIHPKYEGVTAELQAYKIIPVRGYQKLAADRLYNVTEFIQEISQTVLNLPQWLKDDEPVSVDGGGTGATTKEQARTNLGLRSLSTLAVGTGFTISPEHEASVAYGAEAKTAVEGNDERIQAVANKVDKVEGKGLSTEDFSTPLKEKLKEALTIEDLATKTKVGFTRFATFEESNDPEAVNVAIDPADLHRIIIDYSTRVKQPVNLSPTDAQDDLGLSVTLTASEYSSVDAADIRDHREFQVTVTDFSTPLYSVEVFTDDFTIPDDLTPGETYSWRCRDVAESGGKSTWSVATTFTVQAVTVKKPTVTYPLDNDVDIPNQPTLDSSAYEVINGTAAYEGAVYELYDDTDTLIYTSPKSLTAYTVPSGVLADDSTFTVRVQHYGVGLPASEWSEFVTFTTALVSIVTPTITQPADGSVDVSKTLTIVASDFTVEGGTDTFDGAVFEFKNDLGDVIHTSTRIMSTEYTVPDEALNDNTSYTVRVQFFGGYLGASSWSAAVGFTTIDVGIATPSITSPSEGAITPRTVEIVGDAFEVIGAVDTFEGAIFEVRDLLDEVIYTSAKVASTSFTLPIEALADDTAYTVRVQYYGTLLGASNWSSPVGFSTAVVTVGKPSIVSPVNNAVEIGEQPEFESSVFTMDGGLDTFDGLVFEVKDNMGTVVHTSAKIMSYTYILPAGILLEGENIYTVRVQHYALERGASEWSEIARFTTRDVFSAPYGLTWDAVADTYTRTGDANFTAIQSQMKRCVLNGDGTVNYFLDPTDSTKKENGTPSVLTGADGNVMVQIPKFYAKFETTGNLRKMEVSETLIPGFELHPAFIKAGVEVDFRYYPAYQGSQSVSKMISASGKAPWTSITLPNARIAAKANGAGWHLIDWHLLNAVKLLSTIEIGTFDSQSVLGQGNSTGGNYGLASGDSNSIGNASSTSATTGWMSYRGIEHFYASIFKWIDGINIRDQIPYVNGNHTTFASDVFTGDYVSAGVTQPSANGFIKDMFFQMNGFFVKDSTGSDSTYVPDQYYRGSGNRIVSHGGHAVLASSCGSFCLSAHQTVSYSYAFYGSGIAF